MKQPKRILILNSSEYVDRALSARTADRPDFQRMIADSAKRLFDVVRCGNWTVSPVTAMTAPTTSMC